jgi:hypothetical protein
MRASLLLMTLLFALTGSAFAHTIQGGSHATAGPVAKAGGGAGVVSSGALKGVTVSHAVIAGHEANLVELPQHLPLTQAVRSRLRSQGYAEVIQDGATYFCQQLLRTTNGPRLNCLH